MTLAVATRPDLTTSANGGIDQAVPIDVHSAYDGSNVVFRLLRMTSWGPGLMNLGYYKFHGFLSFLNLLANLEKAQLRLVQETLRLLDVKPNHSVLDVACGRGKSSFIMNCLHPETSIIGLDLLEPNIDVARLLFGGSPKLSYQQGSAMDLAFENGRFDRVQCLEAAFHFPDRAQFLRESARVLKPGGRLVIVDFAWNSPADRACLNDPETRIVRDVWQWDDMSAIEEYRSDAKAAGFRTLKVIDWSSRVTEPFQKTFECLVGIGKRPWLRKRMVGVNPLLGSLSDDDWKQLGVIAKAHEHMRNRSRYMAFVFEKNA
jgi:MPBQ/MSBQ methyltransferase